MLPDKLFQNEDSNDSDEQKNQINDRESNEEINSSSIAETLEPTIDPSNEQKEHLDDEVRIEQFPYFAQSNKPE